VEIDASAGKLEIIEIPASKVMEVIHVRVESEYVITDKKELEQIGWGSEESITMSEPRSLYIPYSVAIDLESEESQAALIDMVGGHWNLGYDSKATKVTVTEIVSEIPELGGDTIYVLKSSNPNFKTRISSHKSLIEFFSNQKSVVSNYFMMHRDPIEEKIYDRVRYYLP